jgi:quercetin dioxygenase-like cupin family protein
VKRLLLAALLAPLAALADDDAQAKAIAGAMRAVQPELQRCWEEEGPNDPRVQRTLVLGLKVGPGGTAADVTVRVEGDGRIAEPFRRCAVQAMKAVRLGDAFAAGDTLELPVTFVTPAGVTVKRADVEPLHGDTRILIDAFSAGATQASLTSLELAAGESWLPACHDGAATLVYVLSGKAKAGGHAVAAGDALIHDRMSCVPEVVASRKTELLILFAPAGDEQALRQATRIVARHGSAPDGDRVSRGTRHAILGGKGSAEILVEGGPAALTRLSLAARAAVPEHVHAAEAELLYVLDGKGEMTVDGQRYPIEPLMAVHIPAGARHAFTASTAVRALQFYAPSGPEQRFKAKR